MRIVLSTSILFLLLSNAVTARRDKSILYSRTTINLLAIISFIVFETLEITSLSNGIGLFGGLFSTNQTSTTFNFLIFGLTLVILHLTGFYPRKVWKQEFSGFFTLFSKFTYSITNILNKMASQYKIIEYPLILLFIIMGASLLMSSSDVVSIFLSIELQSYGLYLVCSLYRDSEVSTSAGLTYFLLGGLSSCFILLGTSLLYVNSGTTSLENFYIIISLSNLLESSNTVDLYGFDNIQSSLVGLSNLLESSNMINLYGINYMQFSLIIMSVGFLFKISAAPFHFWSPDVYDAIPTIVTTFVAIIAKISILVFLLELIQYTTTSFNGFAGTDTADSSASWTIVLVYSSFLSLIVGTVLGLNQSRIKRLFAYSTISHLGFILLALSINSVESIQAFIFYLMQYSVSNLNAFMLLIAIGYSLYIYTDKNSEKNIYVDKNNSPIQYTNQLKGYFDINPILAISFAITIFSFVGIPPLVGFFAKQMVLSAALNEGYVFITIIAILTSVISAVYYLGIIKQIFFDKSDYTFNGYLNHYSYVNYIKTQTQIQAITNSDRWCVLNKQNIVLSSSLSIIISILTLMISLFMFNSEELLSLVNTFTLLRLNL